MLQTEWNWMVAVDLLLSGAGAITLAIVALLSLVRPGAQRRTIMIGAWVGSCAVLVGVLFLLADVGQRLRALNMFASFTNFGTSWMARGAWSLALTVVCGLLIAVANTPAFHAKVPWLKAACERPATKMALKVVAVIEVLLGCFVAFYTGMLIMASEGVPFWATPYVPACFVCASVAAGAAVTNAIAATAKEPDLFVVRVLAALSLVGAVIVGGLIAVYLGSMAGAATGTTGVTAAESAVYLTAGDCALAFWGGLVVIGLGGTAAGSALTLAVASSERLRRLLPAFALGTCMCAIIGGFMLRWLILAAGLHAQVLVPDQYQSMGGSMFDDISFLQ